jgi:hypothetical protein
MPHVRSLAERMSRDPVVRKGQGEILHEYMTNSGSRKRTEGGDVDVPAPVATLGAEAT